MLPLFTSYVFFCRPEADCYTAMTTNRLCQAIEVTDQQRLVSELPAIEKALVSKTVIDHYPRLPVGSRCWITAGPMEGIEGVVVEKRDTRTRMVFRVTMLGQGALIEINADLLEAIG